ncbi:MAG: T9SS type A sorting domain-containing protein [Bacteroidia bacterium]|nr:T9SS type A sorting domain-containing protein [Bacteroidia bacterium]
MSRILFSAGLAALIWAQQIGAGFTLPASIRYPALRPLTVPSQLRTQSLPWLLPNQDYRIVPTPTNDPNYAGDTLLSNGTGPNTRSNPPAACVGTFFDSLESVGAYIAVSNERFKIGTVSQANGWCAYIDGAIAERYDIAPDLGGTNRTVTIKGIAAWIVNFAANPCSPTTAAPVPDNGDGEYSLIYSLHASQSYTWGSPFYSPSRSGTVPASTAVRTVSKPLSDVRIGNAILGDSGPNCPPPQGSNPSITEVFDFVYFPTPVDVTDSTSYYVALSTERYNVNSFTLSDTLYFLYGPANTGFNPATHPCYNGDTTRIGRSLISWAIYDTVSGDFYSLPSGLVPTWPNWIPTHVAYNPPLKNGLNWVLFPIVYSQDVTTGTWIRGDRQHFMTPYPNPTTDCFHLKLQSEGSCSLQLSLYTLDGRFVKSWPVHSIPAGEAQVVVDVQDISAGTYLLRVQSELGRAAFQVSIIH